MPVVIKDRVDLNKHNFCAQNDFIYRIYVRNDGTSTHIPGPAKKLKKPRKGHPNHAYAIRVTKCKDLEYWEAFHVAASG